MPERVAYCSACDRLVPVVIKPDAQPHPRPAIQDAEDLICLDYGSRCTGALCPLFSTEEDLAPSAARRPERLVDPPRGA
ncbi:MAG: hypothetical protein ACRELD_07930 [Longimicrobiales bacterium]